MPDSNSNLSTEWDATTKITVKASLLERTARLLQESPAKRNLLVILPGLLIGGGTAVVVTSFLFPAAMATAAGLLGLTGPLALIVPLIVVGVIGALYGMGLLAFLERALMKRDTENQRFMMNLVYFCVAVAGISLGVFIAASTPAVLTMLTVNAVGGSMGAVLPFVFAGLITLSVSVAVAYGLYRASGMRESQARWLKVEASKTPIQELFSNLKEAQGFCLGTEDTKPDYTVGRDYFNLVIVNLDAYPTFKDAVQWQASLAKLCKEDKSDGQLHNKLLTKLAERLGKEVLDDKDGYEEDALIFCMKLAYEVERRPAKKINHLYGKLNTFIQEGEKDKALQIIAQLNNINVYGLLGKLGGKNKNASQAKENFSNEFGSNPIHTVPVNKGAGAGNEPKDNKGETNIPTLGKNEAESGDV